MTFSSLKDVEGTIVKDELALAILLELGMKERLSYPELVQKLQIDEDTLKQKLCLLEESDFIKQNPSTDSAKPFSERKYLLSIRGILLLNKIRAAFPEYNTAFKFFF